MGQNNARRLKEKGKAKDDYAAQQEVATSITINGRSKMSLSQKKGTVGILNRPNKYHEEYGW